MSENQSQEGLHIFQANMGSKGAGDSKMLFKQAVEQLKKYTSYDGCVKIYISSP